MKAIKIETELALSDTRFKNGIQAAEKELSLMTKRDYEVLLETKFKKGDFKGSLAKAFKPAIQEALAGLEGLDYKRGSKKYSVFDDASAKEAKSYYAKRKKTAKTEEEVNEWSDKIRRADKFLTVAARIGDQYIEQSKNVRYDQQHKATVKRRQEDNLESNETAIRLANERIGLLRRMITDTRHNTGYSQTQRLRDEINYNKDLRIMYQHRAKLTGNDKDLEFAYELSRRNIALNDILQRQARTRKKNAEEQREINKEVAKSYAEEKKEDRERQKNFDKKRNKFLKEGEAPAETPAEKKAREIMEENKVRLAIQKDRENERLQKEQKRFDNKQNGRLISLKAVEDAQYHDKNKQIQDQIRLVNALAQAEEARYAKTGKQENKSKADEYRKRLQSLRDELQLQKEAAQRQKDDVALTDRISKNLDATHKQVLKEIDDVTKSQLEKGKAWRKMLAEQTKQSNQETRDTNQRYVQNRKDFDRFADGMKNGTLNSNDELSRLRTQFLMQEKVAKNNEPENIFNRAQQTRKLRLEEAQRNKDLSKQIQLLNSLAQAEEARYAKTGNKNNQSRAEAYRNELRTLQAQNKAAKEAERNLNIQNRLEKSFFHQSTLLGRLGGLASRYFSIYSVVRFAKSVAETTGYFQQQQIALEGIIGSASEAQKILDQIKSFALQSPFQTKELVGFTKQLSAYGIETEKLFPTVKELADISAGLGVDMSRLILAYGQVKSASVLRGQELRQFTEAGVPMVDHLAKKFTKLNGTLVTTGDIFKMISERRVSFEVVSEILSDMTAEGGKFYKMQENLINTLTGQISKLRDMWTLALNDMGSSVGKVIMTIVKGLQGAIKHTASILSGGVVAAGIMRITNAVRATRVEFEAMTKARQKAVGGLSGYMKMSLKAFGANAMYTAAAVGFGFLIGKITEAIIKARELGVKMNEAASSVMKDTSRMVSGLGELSKKITEANVGTKKYKDAVSALASNYGDYLSEDFINKLNNTDETARQLAGSFRDVASAIQEVIKQEGMYKSLVAQGGVAAELAGNRTKANMLKTGVGQRFGVNDKTNQFNSEIARYINQNGMSLGSFRSAIIDVVTSTITEQAKAGTAFEKLDEEISKEIKGMFVDLSDNAVKDLVDWVNYAGIDEESYNEAIAKRNAANSTTYAKILKPFEDAQKIISDGEKTGYEQYGKLGNDMRIRQAMREAMEVGGFSTYSGSKLESLLNDSSKYDYGTASEILEAVEELRKTIDGNDNAQLGRLSKIEGYFKQGVNVRKNGDHAEAITNAFSPIKSGSVTVKSDEASQIDLLEFFMTRLGLTKEQAAGLLGNLQQESSMKPGSINSIGAEGLVQWLGPRKPKILEHINKTFNKDYASIIEASFEEQIEAVAWELEESEKRAFNLLKKATTAEEAADVVRQYYERPEPGSEEQRRKYAKDYYTGILTGYNVSSSISNGKGYSSWFEDELLKPYALQYGSPTDFNINEKRDALAAEIANQEAKYKKEAADGDYTKEHKDREYIIQNLKKLYQDEKMYGGVYQDRASGGLMSFVGELFSWIKEARNKETEMMTLTGNTSMLSDRAIATGSGPLHDFFAPGSVFSSFVDKLKELGLEEGKIFKARDLERFQSSNYRNADGTTNYQKASTDLLEFLKQRAEALKNDNLIEFVRKQTAEMEKFFAQDAVKQQIDLALKELRGINSTLAKTENDRKNYETLLPQIGADAAAEVINNPSVTKAGYAKSTAAYANLTKIANSTAARGLMTSDAGADLAMLLQGGMLNIKNLGGLFDIIQGLQEAMTDPKNREKFESIMPMVIDAINKMIEALLDDAAKNAESQSSKTKAGVSGTAAREALADRLSRLKKIKDANGNEVEDTKGKIEAVQDYYKAIAGDLYAQWTLTNYGDEKTGVSDKGRRRDNYLRNSSLVDMYKKKVYAELGTKSGTNASQVDYEKADDKVIKFAAKCEEAAAVISKVSETIQGIGKITDSVFNLMDNTNGVHLEDGVYVQDNNYSTEKAVVGTIMDFAEGMSGAAEAFVNGDFLGGLVKGITSLIDFFSNVFNSVDAAIQEQIEAYEVSNAKLGKKIEELSKNLKDAVGGEVWDIQKEQMLLQKQQIDNLKEMERLEASKKKGDPSQAQALRDQWQELEESIADTIRNIRQEVLGTADELSSTLSDAFVEAFRNGENAARSWRDAVIRYVGDVLKNVIFEKALAKDIEKIFEKTIGKQIDNIGFAEIGEALKSETNVRGLVNGIQGIFNTADDIYNNLPTYLKDVLTYNPSSQNLGSGIQSITEDTGRTLEALQVSMLSQVVDINVSLGDISGIAEAQLNGLATIIEYQEQIAGNTKVIKEAIDEMRSGFKPLQVSMR